MKKLTLFLLAAVLLLHLSGCGMERAEVPAFTENEADFLAVAAFARPYFAEHREEGEEFIVLSLEGDLIDYGVGVLSVSEELAASVERICAAKFSHLWVAEEYVIFWEDETHKYGLLFTDMPKTAVESIIDPSVGTARLRKITSDWYEFDRGGI